MHTCTCITKKTVLYFLYKTPPYKKCPNSATAWEYKDASHHASVYKNRLLAIMRPHRNKLWHQGSDNIFAEWGYKVKESSTSLPVLDFFLGNLKASTFNHWAVPGPMHPTRILVLQLVTLAEYQHVIIERQSKLMVHASVLRVAYRGGDIGRLAGSENCSLHIVFFKDQSTEPQCLHFLMEALWPSWLSVTEPSLRYSPDNSYQTTSKRKLDTHTKVTM